MSKVPIVSQPTPLERLPRLSETLGIDLFVKRDDLAGPSLGGNKSRQLEYYFGAALEAGADTVLITGAVQSNFVRLTAAVAATLGMQAVVQLEDRVGDHSQEYQAGGNALLCDLLGARILRYPKGEDEAGADAALHTHAEILRAERYKPYVIHLSEGHPPLGALGYVDAAHEILAQNSGFDFFVVASGSGSTHSGLLAGLRGAGSTARVIGSCVRRPARAQAARISRIISRLSDISNDARAVKESDIEIWDGALAPGYGQPGQPAVDAMKLMARQAGLVLDPVYTSKSFAAIPALVESGQIPRGSRVCFVHTGGLGALGAYGTAIRDIL
ncbi:D-cysteine desulfhydrase family protein [uncultured Roseobacter sp.]|uniref:D-cysteine desulfhydrase family protein n=1 Tax=uncultured Roseobacter sp. TaxID=114847 RepID=UPI00261CBCC3|nr:D-cysteine desulfhydrase family protein [uncultured Roseobacter sp.]